ncbi:alpha/beta hydrolase [Oryzifoliimicrobium ureilyticus]|uniref:alpha/beta hydrolase n=1 Tax=Oryzifoliimicrobium ureilyticus TaxID=3113724 RepID=UPI0030765E93
MNEERPDPSLLSPPMRALMEKMAAEFGPLPDATLLPPAEGRALSARLNEKRNVNLPAMMSEAEVWVPADTTLGSAPCRMRILTPENAGSGTILFVHGGGFAFCSPETHERCARVLAIEAGMAVAMPDYRLAPEHPFPSGLRDVVACLRALLNGRIEGISAKPLLIAGDSAGANLALASMLHEQTDAQSLPNGALLFYGNFSADLTGASYARFDNGPGLTIAKMERYWQWYAGDRDISGDPLACPLVASDDTLLRMPQLYLMAAGVDPLYSDTLMLHERLQNLGRRDDLDIVPGVIHGFLQNTNELEEARAALRRAGKAARRMIHRT